MFLFASHFSHAQAITPTPQLAEKYFTLIYENDVFNHTDRYYTQGIRAEIRLPLTKSLPLFKAAPNRQVGFAIEDNGYTPTSIIVPHIQYGDRPYAACLLGNVFLAARDSSRRQTVTIGVTVGVVGPAAAGEWMQTTIHRNTGSALPLGWQYQVANDLALNGELSWLRQILQTRFAGMAISAAGRLGTLGTKATASVYFTAGLLPRRSHSFSLYAYATPAISAIGYDATLQGGVFNRTSPYVIYAGDISRITYGYRTGIVCAFRHVQLEYSTTFLSKEFTTGDTHRWGRIAASWLW